MICLITVSLSMSTVPMFLSACRTMYLGWLISFLRALFCRHVMLGWQRLLYFACLSCSLVEKRCRHCSMFGFAGGAFQCGSFM